MAMHPVQQQVPLATCATTDACPQPITTSVDGAANPTCEQGMGDEVQGGCHGEDMCVLEEGRSSKGMVGLKDTISGLQAASTLHLQNPTIAPTLTVHEPFPPLPTKASSFNPNSDPNSNPSPDPILDSNIPPKPSPWTKHAPTGMCSPQDSISQPKLCRRAPNPSSIRDKQVSQATSSKCQHRSAKGTFWP